MTEDTQHDVEPDEDEPIPAMVLGLDGDSQTFRASKRYANKFLLVKLQPELYSSGLPALTAVTRLVESQVAADEQPRLAAYLEEHGDSDDYLDGLYASLVECWSGESVFPSQPSVDSSVPTSTGEIGQ